MILILALWFWLAGATIALADPISMAVTSLASVFGGGAIATFVAQEIIGVALYFGINYISQALAGKQPTTTVGGVNGSAQGGGVVPRSFIFGRWATPGSFVYRGTWDTEGADHTPNEFYVQVLALSDLPVTGMVELWVDGVKRSYNPAASQAGRGQIITDFTVTGKDHMWVKFYNGNQNAADSYLTSKFSADPNYPLTNNFVGTGVAYAIVTTRVNQELFQGFPECLFVLDGVPEYDLRQDSTNGGSGTQRWGTPGTWGSVNGNPIINLYYILRGIYYAGSWFYGLQSSLAYRLPSTNWIAMANVCDTAIAKSGGGTEPQFACGGELSVDAQPFDVITSLLTACNGRLAEVGGRYKPYVGPAGASVMTISDDDIAITEEQTFTPFFGIGEGVNGITAKYISPEEGWVEKEAPTRLVPTNETYDGNRRLLADVTYGYVSSKRQAQRLMSAALKEARRARRHTFTLTGLAAQLEPVDFMIWNSVRNGYTTKKFRIDGVVYQPNMDTVVDVTEVDPTDYDWVPASDELPVVDGVLAEVRPVPQQMVAFNVTGLTFQVPNGRQLPGIRLTWDANVVDTVGVGYEVRLSGGSALVADGSTDRWDLGKTDISNNLNGATAYEVRARYLPRSKRSSDFSPWLPVNTPDTRTQTSELNTALQNDLNKLSGSGAGTFDDLQTRVTTLESETNTANHVFAQPAAPVNNPPTLVLITGDLWFDSDDNNKLYRWSGTAWVFVPLAGGAKTFFQAAAPTVANSGDLWVDSDDKNKLYLYQTGAWVLIRDTDIEGNFNALTSRINNLVTADSATYNALTAIYSRFQVKSHVFYVSGGAVTDGVPVLPRVGPTVGPTITEYNMVGGVLTPQTKTEPLAIGDIWFDSTDSNRMYRYVGGATPWSAVPDQTKNKVFVQPSAPPSTTPGLANNDIWLDSDGSVASGTVAATPANSMYRWNATNQSWDSAKDADITTNKADISNEQSTRLTSDSAIASVINAVNTTLKGMNAGGHFRLVATQVPDSATLARFEVFLTVGTPGTPATLSSDGKKIISSGQTVGSDTARTTAGFYLDIIDKGATMSPRYVSRATFDVDSFVVGRAGTAGVPPFKVNVGSNTVFMRNVQVENGLSSLTANLGTITAGIIESAGMGYDSKTGNASGPGIAIDLTNNRILFFE